RLARTPAEDRRPAPAPASPPNGRGRRLRPPIRRCGPSGGRCRSPGRGCVRPASGPAIPRAIRRAARRRRACRRTGRRPSAGSAAAADMVGVPGSSTQFPAAKDATIDGKPVSLVLTGCALRQKYFFNVYSVASYVQDGAKVRTPEELAAADCPKRLELVMERT